MEPEKTPRKRASKFIKDLIAPARQPSRDKMLWATRIVLVLVVLLAILTFIGLPFGITLWAWVKVLIVPAVLAIGGYLFNSAQSRATQAAAERRAQDEALQAYLGEMGSLMLEKGLGSSQANATCVPQDNSQVPTLAQARTLTVVRMLGPGGKRSVLDFLYESKLISDSGPAIVKLGGRDSHGGAANLSCADLKADHLPGADLSGAILTGANLREANLREANLSGAYLNDADLRSANLSHANLAKAKGVTNDQLRAAARSLKGATMPNGQKYEDWLKSKDQGENGKSNGTS